MYEIEIRTFVTKDKYEQLYDKFIKNEGFVVDKQLTIYFDFKIDVRLQLSNQGCKVWIKWWKIHDIVREEKEFWFSERDFLKVFEMLSVFFKHKTYWLRKRLKWYVDDIKVCIDYTKGYGRVVEVEKLVDDEKYKEKVKRQLEDFLKNLVKWDISKKEEFQRRYKEYVDSIKVENIEKILE